MSSTGIAITAVLAVVLVAILLGGWLWWRHRSLRTRFGPEYDRVASQHDSRLAAERELRARERRHEQLELHDLDEATRARYSRAWQDIQAQFVEAPDTAIGAAEELVTQLIADRGYPTDHDEQLEQLSVEHAHTLGNYRAAHEIYRQHQQGGAHTEQLRQALVHYRALFADLLEEPVMPSADESPQRAGTNRHSDRAGTNRHSDFEEVSDAR